MLPIVCLFLLLSISVAVVWLCAFGLPGFALRYIEKAAARQGVYLDIGAVRLIPSLGPMARVTRIQLYHDAEKRHRVASVRSIAAGLKTAALMRGEAEPNFLRVTGANINIPVSSPKGETLNVRVKDIEVNRGPDGVVHITNGQLTVQGILVKFGGSLTPELFRAPGKREESQQNVLQALVAPYQHEIDTIYRKIRAQHWEAAECPVLEVRLDVPHPDLLKKSRISVRATVPRFDYTPRIRFQHAVADLRYKNDMVTINSLHIETVGTGIAGSPDAAESPNATADLQGGYDLEERRLSVTIKSTAALLRMLRPLCNEKTRNYLFKFRHPDDNPPRINLAGDVTFGEDFTTFRDVRVRGSLDQDNLMVGSNRVNHLSLSFYYDNGNFNIDKCELQFQDGLLQAVARAKDRVGQAEISVDMPVRRILALVNELSPVPVALPEGLVLGEQVKMNLLAELDAPPFSPEQSVWQDYVPKVHKLGASVECQMLSYADYHAVHPSLSITMSGIRQDDKLCPQQMQQVDVRLQAECFQPPAQATLPPVQVSGADLNVTVKDIAFNTHSLPETAAAVELHAEAASVAQAAPAEPAVESDTPPSASPKPLFEVQSPSVVLRAQQIGVTGFKAPESLRVQRASLLFDSSAANFRSVHVSDMHICLDNVANIVPLGETQRLFSAASLSASLNALKLRDETVGNVKLNAELEEYTEGHISLTVSKENDSPPAAFSAHPDWSDPQQIVLNGVDLHLPGELLRMFLNLAGAESEDVEVPNAVHARGNLRLLPSMQVKDFALHVDVPELVRTPHRMAVFRGHRVPVGIHAYVDAARSQDGPEMKFNALLDVVHSTGTFHGLVTGSSAGRIHLEKGLCTIRPDVVDELLDNRRAHSIICDFRFAPSSRSTISDIRVDVDLENGVQVDSTCRVELLDTQYQLNGIEENDAGQQRVRPGVGGGFPFTHVNRATCGVAAHVLIDKHSEDGTPLPDETVVTITDAELDYDNTPWLRRNKWNKGTKQSVLKGKRIIIDVENSFLELQNVEGKVYPAYSLGMFYSDLFDFLEDVVLPLPAYVKTERCVFPIYDDCKLPMSGVISVTSERGAGFRFIGTTIPLDNFSGFIALTDSFVQLDRLNAKSWDGVLDAVVRIGYSGQHTSLDGYVKANCLDMKKIAASYGSEQSRALCSGEIRFRAPQADVNSLSAYGSADIIDGDIMKLSLFRPVGEMITDLPRYLVHLEKSAKEEQGMPQKPGFFTRTFNWIFKKLGNVVGTTGSTAAYLPGVNHVIAYDLKEAHANFRIEHGHLFTTKMNAIGSNLDVKVHADIDLNSLSVRGHLWPKISSIPMLALAPLTVLSDFMIDIVLYGTLSDVKWRIAFDKRIKNSRKTKPQSRPVPQTNPGASPP